MKAVVIDRFGDPDVLEVRDVPRPDPEYGHILVRVRTSALNRADVFQRQGRYPAPPGDMQQIPGIEFAGEVAELGRGAREWRVGDRVFGIIGGGAHAEYLTIHERAVALMPNELDWDSAGAIPEAFITAHDALITQANARPAEHVLISAVGSGVGLAAVQLARAAGAIPYGTSRTADKIERAKDLGLADGAVLTNDLAPLAEYVDRWTNGRGVDVVLDLVGGPYVSASIAALGLRGRLMLVGTMAGGRADVPIGIVMGKRLTIVGTVLRARSLEEKIAATRAFAKQVAPLVARGVVRPVIDSVFPLEAIGEAHRRMESNETYGKIVIRCDVG